MLLRHLRRDGGLPHLFADQAAERPPGFLPCRRGGLLPEGGQPIWIDAGGGVGGGRVLCRGEGGGCCQREVSRLGSTSAGACGGGLGRRRYEPWCFSRGRFLAPLAPRGQAEQCR